jgi:hypothetical protein
MQRGGIQNIKAAYNLVACALALCQYLWHPTVAKGKADLIFVFNIGTSENY